MKLAFAATWVDLVNVILTEVNRRQASHNIIYVEYVESKKKKTQMNLFAKQIDS